MSKLVTSKIFDSRKGRQVFPARSICEVHRQIYDILVTELGETNPNFVNKITPLLEEVYIDGIKMAKKLVEYKCSLSEYQDNSSPEVKRLRQLRIDLTEQLHEAGRNKRKK